MEEEKVTLKKTTIWKGISGVLAILLIISIITGGFGIKGGSSNGGNAVAPNPSPNPSPSPGGVALVDAKQWVDDGPVLGNKNAKLTMVEFSDYQCPFCRKFWSESFHQIKSQYIDTGKVKLVFRNFPLTSLHPMAQKSAEAAECVKEKGGDEAYYKMHDKMFEEENKLDGGDPQTGPVKSTVSYTNDDLKKWAKDLGYDISSCLDSGKYTDKVGKDEQDATAAGGQGTPYFLIGNTPISGAQPFVNFKATIDRQL